MRAVVAPGVYPAALISRTGETVPISLAEFVGDFSAGIMAADAKRPAAVNQRSGVAFQPGIGPHTESRTIELAVLEMRARSPERYAGVSYDVPYPSATRQACDLELTGEG